MSEQPEALFLADVIENDPTSAAHHDAAAAELRRLHAECDALRADAERYRWLRDIDTGPSQIWELISDDAQPPYMTLKSGNILDATIDAARAALKETK